MGRWSVVAELGARHPDQCVIIDGGNYHHFTKRGGACRVVARTPRYRASTTATRPAKFIERRRGTAVAGGRREEKCCSARRQPQPTTKKRPCRNAAPACPAIAQTTTKRTASILGNAVPGPANRTGKRFPVPVSETFRNRRRCL